MLRYKLSLILFLICYCHFGFSWPDGGTANRDAEKPKCTHGGILNGVFLHGGLKSRNDTIFTNIPNMQACISKCCKVDKCDLAMMIGKVCHAVKCQDEDSCQISNSKKEGSSLKAQISFITKGEDIKEEPGLQKTTEPISMATNPQLQEDPEIRAEDENQPKLTTKLNSLDPASIFSSEKYSGASSNDYNSASGSDESGDESETNWTSESGSKPAKIQDYFGLTEESSGEESSGEKNSTVEKTGNENSGDSSEVENSGSGDAISVDGKFNSRQSELDVLPKPSSGRSAIPTPRNAKLIRLGDSSASFDSESVGNSDKSSSALNEKHDNDGYDDNDDDSGSGSGKSAVELTNASGNEEIESSGVRQAMQQGKSTKGANFSKHVITAMRATGPSATPIKTSIPTKLASNSTTKNDPKKPSSFSHKNRGSKSDSSAKMNEKLKKVEKTQKKQNTKLSRKEQKSRNIKKSSKIEKNNKDQNNKNLKALASARRKAMPLQDLGSQGEASDSLSLAAAESVGSKIEDTPNQVAKDFSDISRGHIIEKPSSKIEKESLAFIGKSELQDLKENADLKTRKTLSKLQYQLSNLLAKDSEHMVNSKNAQKMSRLPNKGIAKRQKLFDKIRRIQREREKERHYTQAMKKAVNGNPSPLSIIFMRESAGKMLKYLVHQFSDWRGWKRDELLRPQEDMRCRRGVTIRGATLKGGMLAGDFETVGMVNNQQTCIKACCGNRRCDVALMLGKECFNVRCYSENLCGLAPATTLFDEVTPVITYVRGHISKRSIDYDDFDDDIIESVRKQDAELIRRLEYLTE